MKLALYLPLTLILGAASVQAQDAVKPAFPLPAPPKDVSTLGTGIQRTMTLLATSTPQHRNKVKILFYGQSITEQNWWKEVAADLRRRFPNADLEIENRAIGGFASQLLIKPAEHDLYPFYPDLLVFYVYGSHTDYEKIIESVRRRTTSEILIQTEHATQDADLTEETDPAKVTPANWSAWMSYHFLPQTAKKYGAELVDQRTAWKEYLRANNLPAKSQLVDGVHLNDAGNFLMAELVKPHLRYDPKFPQSQWKNLVRDIRIGHEVKWHKGHLKVEFEGNRIDAIAAPRQGKITGAQVLIDGKKPSQFPELYVFTRPSKTPNVGWPAIIRVSSQQPLLLEEWTARITEINADASQFKFEVFGSKTGPDGGGRSDQKFVSKSGRVVIEPEDWHLHRDWEISHKGTPAGWEIKWQVVPLFVDRYVAPKIEDSSREHAVTLAQGLSNGRHTLELIAEGKGAVPLQALRVYQPPLK